MLRRVALVRTVVRGMYPLYHQGNKNRGARTRLGSPILVVLMMQALSSTETSVLTRTTRRNIPEDSILQMTPSYMLELNSRKPSSIWKTHVMETQFDVQ
jgi:hypothetical protein